MKAKKPLDELHRLYNHRISFSDRLELGMAEFALGDCDEWCEFTSVTSKTAVNTFGFVVHDFQQVMEEGECVTVTIRH